MNRTRILVVGCGEHARMLLDNVEEEHRYDVFGLTTHIEAEVGQSVYGYRVLCLDSAVPELLATCPDIGGYVLGVGDMATRDRLFRFFDRLLPAVNIIHPAATVSRHATIGRGNLLEAYTKVANGATVGDHCIVNSFSAINHDQTIGTNVLIAGCVSMAGTGVGDGTIISDGASIGFKKRVGKRCIIGDGAVVTRDIPDNVIAYGNPARIVRKNEWLP